MKVLIIEDEPLASDRLEQMINEAYGEVEILGKLDSVEEAVAYFQSNQIQPDLSFMDIQLSDGVSLDIFQKTKVNTPVIFTTAYDNYTLEAFKVNSVDYLLKPIDPDELRRAIEKYHDLFNNSHYMQVISDRLAQNLRDSLTNNYKKRFAIRNGNNLKVKDVRSVAYIRAEGRSVFIYMNKEGKKYLIDHTMEELETRLLDPQRFFRVNRQFFVCADNITEAKSYINSRLKVILNIPCEYELIVSREKVSQFKEWIAQ